MDVALTVPSSTPNTAQIFIVPESSDSTIVFGIFGLCVGIVVAILQLRLMRRRKRMLDVFELA